LNFTLKHISKNYGDVKALKGISLRLPRTGVVGLLGPNGAGKSTLMKILTGYHTRWEGAIQYGDLDFRKERRSMQAKIGYLPENNPLYSELYVREYLEFVARLYQLKKPPIAETIEAVGVTDYAHRKIATLSKGYKQRVGLAAALLHDPEIVILDEPTTGLDPNQLVDVRALIKRLGQEKLIVLSTHILPEVESMCNHVLIIHKGALVLDVSMESLRKGQKQTVLVEFDYRVETETLSKIEGVEKAVNTFDFQYELSCTKQEDIRPKVFDFAHDNQLKILSLQQKNQNLADLFKQLTSQ